MQRLPNPILDVEQELSAAVRLVGGIRVDEITGKTPGHRIADFLFDSFAVIAELKCLEKDQIHAPEFVKRVSAVYEKHRRQTKGRFPIVFGTRQLSTQGLPSDFQMEIARLYAVPIWRVIASADEQIAETKARLPREDHRGVLLLVNDGNTALDPAHIRWTLGECLGGENFPNINHVIFFTVNMSVEVPPEELVGRVRDDQVDIHVWYSSGRRLVPRIDPGFEPALRNAWIDHLRSITGYSEQFEGNDAMLKAAKNRRR